MEWVAIKLLLGTVFGGIGRFISAAFTFLTTKPGVYLLIAAVAGFAYWHSGEAGYKRAKAEDKAAYALQLAQAETDAANQARQDQIALDAGIQAAAEKAAFLRGKAQAHTIVLTKEVPTYVTVETDRSFPVPCGLYRLLRAAEAGPGTDPASISLPAGLTDGTACPLTASDLAVNGIAVIGDDYQLRAQVAALQDLALELKAAAER